MSKPQESKKERKMFYQTVWFWIFLGIITVWLIFHEISGPTATM
jgi:hypothetical protein